MLLKIISNSKYDSLFEFLEKRFIMVITSIAFLFILILNFTVDLNLNINWINKLNYFVQGELTNELKSRDGTLISISSIFIGVYFTTFTLMTTISYKSTFSELNKIQFSNLINYIRNAFLASFGYILFSLISPLLNNEEWLFSLIVVPLLSYILLSALRFGWLIYLILIRDLQAFIDGKTVNESKEQRLENLIFSLEQYLKKIEHEENLKSQRETDELIKNRKNDPTTK
ncbi:hypothetical protein [Solibacillus sp.]|uniref:hypothetical protein n=1 Tax=Solibacillus sp. TaxID=1909654 RepID=UPI0033150CEE